MADQTIPAFTHGIHNLVNPENIPLDAAQDSSNFVTQDGRVVLVPGRELLGAAGAVGSMTGLHKGFKTNGDTVLYAKFGTIIKYFDGTNWQNCITGLTADAEYTFANYSSLAGAFTFANGADGYWKIINANPGSPIDVFDVTGAGDTVIAVIALAMTSGASMVGAAHLANYAAGIVVEKPGTAVATQAELIARVLADR